jgi:amidase
LRDVIAFNEAHGETMLRYGQARMSAAEATSGALTEPVYLRARALDLVEKQADGIDRVLREHRLDALVSGGSSFSHVPTKAGYPSVTVPCGLSADGPLGLTFTGTAYSEPLLLKLAYAYEQATKLRRAPAFGEGG